MKSSINVWVGNYGNYTIPDGLFSTVRMTAQGYPDKRSILTHNKFMEWVKQMEDNKQLEYKGDCYE